MGQKNTLVLIFKQPQLGVGKQRLAVDIGKHDALMVALQLFEVSKELLMAWPYEKVAAPARADDLAWAKNQFREGVSLVAQSEGNLGERIEQLDQQLRLNGGKANIYMGSDAPLLSTQLCLKVLNELERSDVVLVPSRDGGVSLMANIKPWPSISELPWSTDKLADSLARQCENSGLKVAFIEQCDDIDHREDLDHYCRQAEFAVLSSSQQKLINLIEKVVEK